MSLKWKQKLSNSAWVNSVAISDNGSRLVGGTFKHLYKDQNNGHDSPVPGTYGTFCYDSDQREIFSDQFDGLDGIFAVAISGDGSVAVGGGLIAQNHGILRIYDCRTAVNGQADRLYDSTSVKGRVNVVSASRRGEIVAAAANELYVLARNGNEYQRLEVPQQFADAVDNLGKVSAVVVHPLGTWLAACNKRGGVLVAQIDNGAITDAVFEQTRHRGSSIPFLSIAIAEDDDSFVLGGGDSVYQGLRSEFLDQRQLTFYSADVGIGVPRGTNGNPAQNVRWVAVTKNGAVIATVANRDHGGQLLVFSRDNDNHEPVATGETQNSPNGVSMDSDGEILVVSDGFPANRRAAFYRFDPSNGNEIWHEGTSKENWPVMVSPDGQGIGAGGDDGFLYYFLP